jgi:hypothetical protein
MQVVLALDLNLKYQKTVTCKKGNQDKDFIRNYEKERKIMLVVLGCLGQWSLR